MSQTELTKKWEQECSGFLKGKRIAQVRYMTEKEAQDFGWYKRPLVIIFEGGGYIIPMADDEGNDGGAMSTSNDKIPVIPVMH